MANPFFSGRIPPGLADKIDAHLLATGETRSELLVRLLRVEIGDNKSNNVGDNQLDNRLTDLNTRLERLERLINNKADNSSNRIIDNKSDNVDDLQSSDQGWVNLAMIAAQLQVLPKSISGAASKRGRDIGGDTIEFEVAGHTIYKKGSGLKALYRFRMQTG
jgi:TolA-binding protein